MTRELLTPSDVDRIFRYPTGRAARLARAGTLPCIRLPDGAIRFDAEAIETLVKPRADLLNRDEQGGASESANA
jgi:hypothetical protein